MLIKKILKITGYIFVPLLPMVVAIYFLFPYLNEEKHKKVVEENTDDFVIGDTTEVEMSTFSSVAVDDSSEGVEDIGKDFAQLEQKNKAFQQDIDSLRRAVDSVTTVKDSLEQQLIAKGGSGNSEISEEEFSENIKSLLGLDVEQLTPILSNMSNDQLVRMFKAGSGLQRKKLLRSLESDRAAKLMTEVL